MVFLNSQVSQEIDNDFRDKLKNPELLFQHATIIKDDKSTTVATFQYNNRAYLIKRFNARNMWHMIKRALRQTRAKSCWEMSLQFERVGLCVPKPIAKLEKQFVFLKGDSYFVSEFIEGHELLGWLPQQDQKTITEATKQIRNLFAIFHDNQLSHGDMKATNLLWSKGNIFLIDLDVAKQHISKMTFQRANKRDKRRFCRNGDFFEAILKKD